MNPWEVHNVRYPAQPLEAVRRWAEQGELAWLDSAAGGRWSLIARAPLAVIEQYDDEPARLIVHGRVVLETALGWRLLAETVRKLPRMVPAPAPLAPGWLGFLGYESAGQLERLPGPHRNDWGLPLLRMALFDRAIVLDHVERRAVALAAPGIDTSLGGAPQRTASADWREQWEAAVAAADSDDAGAQPASPRPLTHYETALDEYDHRVQRALDYIAAGDIYQVNLAHRLRLSNLASPMDTFRALRATNPADYAALLAWEDAAVCSASPELFLQVRGDRALTRPIKGTRPRTGDPATDAVAREALLGSEKEQAELAMIVDLHRNDLGRVCRYGSVRVESARRLETHPTVFHTVADVSGSLREDRDAMDLIAACFPAGSITGAPKIRAMEIIHELETTARGAYTGAIGAVGLDGNATLNVAIRTLQQLGRRGVLHVGGGIVADSDPAAEYEETLAKGRGILAALRGEGIARVGAEPV